MHGYTPTPRHVRRWARDTQRTPPPPVGVASTQPASVPLRCRGWLFTFPPAGKTNGAAAPGGRHAGPPQTRRREDRGVRRRVAPPSGWWGPTAARLGEPRRPMIVCPHRPHRHSPSTVARPRRPHTARPEGAPTPRHRGGSAAPARAVRSALPMSSAATSAGGTRRGWTSPSTALAPPRGTARAPRPPPTDAARRPPNTTSKNDPLPPYPRVAKAT